MDGCLLIKIINLKLGWPQVNVDGSQTQNQQTFQPVYLEKKIFSKQEQSSGMQNLTKNYAFNKSKSMHTKTIIKEIQQNHPEVNITKSPVFKQSVRNLRLDGKEKIIRRQRKTRAQRLSDFSLARNNEIENGLGPDQSKSLKKKLRQIEEISKTQPIETDPRVQYDKECLQGDWKKLLKSKNISAKSFHNIKKLIKNSKVNNRSHVQSSSWQFRDELSLTLYEQAANQRPGDICHFVAGFPNQETKQQFEQFTDKTNLHLFVRNVKKYETIGKFYKEAARTRPMDRLHDDDVRQNFVSTVYLNEFMKKNGSNNPRSKKIMALSRCVV